MKFHVGLIWFIRCILAVSLLAANIAPTYAAWLPAETARPHLVGEGLVISPTGGLSTSEGGTNDSFTVALLTQPTNPVTVNISSQDISEVTVSPAILEFTTENWNTGQTVTLNGVNDALADGDQVVSITFGVASDDSGYSGLAVEPLNMTNMDDDVAGLFVNPTSGLSTNEDLGTGTFQVRLLSEPTGDVTVPITSNDTSEGTVLTPGSGVLTFTPANWSTLQTVTIRGVNDSIADGDTAYTLSVGPTSGASYGSFSTTVNATNADNDSIGVIISSPGGLTTTEAGGSDSFTVRLNSQPTDTVSVGVSILDTSEASLSPAALTFLTSNWNTPQTITVTGVDDAIVDGTVGYTVDFDLSDSTDPDYQSLSVNSISGSTTDNDTRSVIVNPTGGLTTTESGGQATFTIRLGSQPSATVAIAVGVSDSSEGSVTASPFNFTTANWNVNQTVTVTGVDDFVTDGNVGYTVTFTLSGGDPGYAGLSVSSVGVTNTDNDTAGVVVSPAGGLTTTEAGGSASFTVRLSSQPSTGVEIDLVSTDPSEGQVSPATLSFTTSSWNSNQTVTVTGQNDAIVDGNVGYAISFDLSDSADGVYAGLSVTPVSVTNTDNDAAGLTINPTGGLTTTEALGTATFTVRLTSEPGNTVQVALTSSDVSEGTVSPATLTFNSTNWSVPQTVTVTGVNDFEVDGTVSYSISLSLTGSADTTYKALIVSPVSVINTDNDAIGVILNPTSGFTTTEAGGSDTFTVRLNSQPTGNVIFGMTSSDLTEGTVLPASLTFTTANWNTPQTVTITGVDDDSVDGDVVYSIAFDLTASVDTAYKTFTVAPVSVTNTDGDVIGLTLTPSSGLVTTELGGTASFTIKLSSLPVSGVTVALTVSDTTEASITTPTSPSLTFSTANWNVAQTVTLTGVDDDFVDGNIAYNVSFDLTQSADTAYKNAVVTPLNASNTDDDTAGVTVAPEEGVSTQEGATLPSTFTLQLKASPQTGKQVVLTISSSDTTEATVSPATMTFTPSDWDVAKTVTVTPVDDFIQDGSVAYTIGISRNSATTDSAFTSGLLAKSVPGLNLDNDSAGLTVSPGSGTTKEADQDETGEGDLNPGQELKVKLNTEPVANVIVTMSSSNVLGGEISTPPAKSLTFTPANWNIEQSVVVLGAPDSGTEANLSYTVTFSVSTSTDTVYKALNSADLPTVTLVNVVRPTGVGENYAVNYSGITVPAPGLLANDLGHIDNGGFTAKKATDPQHGTLILNSDGSFAYSPTLNYVGTDQFTYYACQLVTSCTAAPVVVTLTVDADPPTGATWVLPVGNEGLFPIRTLTLILEARPSASDTDVDHIWYARYDRNLPVNQRLIDLGSSTVSSYKLEINTDDLPDGYVEIYAFTYDKAGNRSLAPNNRIILSHNYDFYLYLSVIQK